MATIGVELWVVPLVVICIFQWIIYRWRNPKCANGILPPGSMGFPLIGETLQLLIPSNSLDVPPFVKKRLQRYGPIFRTSIAGRSAVISADPEFNHLVLQKDEKELESWYMDSFAKIFKQGERRPDGAYIQKYSRNITLNHFGVHSLRTRLLPLLEDMVNKTLMSWSTLQSIDVKEASTLMTIEMGAKLLFGYDAEKSSTNLTEMFMNFSQGLMSIPLNIPGTAYHKYLQGHRRATGFMREVLREKLASLNSSHKRDDDDKGDLLDDIIKDMDSENFLTEDFIAQLMFGLVFVTYDSTSSFLALAFKLLAENPDVLQEMTIEHEAILKEKQDSDSPITWDDYKSMTFTRYVINETFRIGSISLGLMRRATKDIQVKGYTIPEGWAVIIVTSGLHLNPNAFEDPLVFNPWRWKDQVSASTMSNYFIPFGEGRKQCAGSDYTRVLLSLFFHVLVTKYRWTKVRGGEVGRSPNLHFKQGIHIKISKKQA